ncbi:MAG: isochorismate synthase [Crocinitomix sp.]|jgi:isochorismate synthase
MDEASSEGIIFHSFNGDKILNISELKAINAVEFSTSKKANNSTEHSKAAYLAKFESLQMAIASGKFKKVILSRTKTVFTEHDALTIFDLLNKHYPNTLNYVISNAELGTWIGATPELLLSVEDLHLKTMSLAGTKMPNETWSEKEFEEQQLVTDTILKGLRHIQCKNILIDGPKNIQAGKIEHLLTSIKAELNQKIDWSAVLMQLHPTPAVCGIPTEEARKFIPTLESYDREFYTGFIGILSKNKKDFYVNLRCMQLFDKSAKLYIGGGITAQSNGEAEWNETERKAETLASVLS